MEKISEENQKKLEIHSSNESSSSSSRLSTISEDYMSEKSLNELNENEAQKIVEDELTLIEFQDENIIAEEIKKMESEIKQELTSAKIMSRP